MDEDRDRDIPPVDIRPLWLREPLMKNGQPLDCMHSGCYRYAVRIVAYEKPNHAQFHGQTHNCCSFHSRG